ncbi:type VI secretion system Vgr family protein [Capnocytophaga sputigena]|uniref:type VI secretion system Vgr family protein n=1 Tax=Capnocytophaga sputigena TaxID=1019 RepID=UPI0028E6DC36|nr:type VI secretion system Vgr family protein [Capnocytophaga sputigena]
MTQLRMELKDMKIKTFKEFLEDKTNPVVYCLLSSNGKDFLARENYKVELHQYNCQHDTFTIETPEDSFDAFNEYIMEHSRDLLGQPLTIKFYQYGKVVQHFSGIITRIYCKRQTGGGYGTLYISGNAPSILLDQGKACRSYEHKTLKEIIASVGEGYDNSAQVDSSAGVNTTRALPYTVQYNESDYDFICRLANLYGEYFYYDGSKLIFGNKLQETIDLGENLNLIDEDFNLEMKPQDFEYINYAIDRAEVYRKDAKSASCEYKNNPIQTDAKNASKKLFKKIPQKYHSATSLEQSDIDLEEVVRQERDLRELSLKVTGRSRDPCLRMNTFACLTDINARAMETYRVIKISHYHSGMNYENSFEAIPMMRTPADYNAEAFPKAEQQPAIVKDNNDPQGMGRVRVQFFWQKGDELSPWIRMIQPYAGNGKGFYFIPEIGEEVMVDFENGNAERPFVLGAHYNGAAKSGYKPTTKAIHTQSGTKILLNDEDGSIKIEDAVGNSLIFDGNQKITLSSSIFEINTQQMLIRATDKLHITTNNYVLNVLSQLYIFTAWMKQQVSGFMQVFSNAALIKSNNALDIEAKHAKLSGKERAILDSKKEAVVNSLGVAQLQGKLGNEYSNNGQGIAQAPLEKIGLAVVYFRPLEDWRGEFGFDWLREIDDAQTSFIDSNSQQFTDENYYTILKSGYGDGQHTDLTPNEAYEKLKEQYLRHPINKEGMTNMNEDEYYVPYLTLFPKSYVDTINPTPAVSPMYQATLRMLGEITEDIDRLEFGYDETLFELDKKVLSNKSKIEGLEFLQETITITCKEELDSDKEIRLYAYPKRPAVTSYTDKKGTRPSADLDQLVHRRLAGKIIVVKNDATVRKEEKFVLVKVQTNIAQGEPEKGFFNPEEKKAFYNTLHQALIIPKVEEYGGENSEVYLNLSADRRFHSGGKYVEREKLKTNFYTNQQRQIVKSEFLKYVQEAFFNDPPENRVRYAGYFTVFAFGVGNPDSGGETAGEYELLNRVVIASAIKFFKNVALYAGRGNNAFCHEALHGLGLYHTHREEKNTINGREVDTEPIIKDSKKKYVYKHKTTTNVMSYNQPRNYTTWRWQWSIINPNISE